MRPIQVLISSLLPFLIGLLIIYLMLFTAGGVNSFPFELFVIIVFYIFPVYSIFCLPFYFVIYYLQGQLKRSIYYITVIIFIYIQSFIASFLLHLPLFDEDMVSVVFPLFTIMMLTFVCCIFIFTKRMKRISRIN